MCFALYICTKSNRLIWIAGAVAKLFGQFVYNILQTRSFSKQIFSPENKKISAEKYLREKNSPWHGVLHPLEPNMREFLYRFNINVTHSIAFWLVIKIFLKTSSRRKNFYWMQPLIKSKRGLLKSFEFRAAEVGRRFLAARYYC